MTNLIYYIIVIFNFLIINVLWDFLSPFLTIEKTDLRYEIELKFRYQLYMDPAFPFLISLGIKNLFRGFEYKESGFVGILHLWWGWKNDHISYDKDSKTSILNSGFWLSEWLDSEVEAIKIAKDIEIRSIFDYEKMILVHQNWFNKNF